MTSYSRRRRAAAVFVAVVTALSACGSATDEAIPATASATAVAAAQPTAEPVAPTVTPVPAASTPEPTAEPTAVPEPEPEPTDGTWLFDGYGQVLVVESGDITAGFVPAGGWCAELSDIPAVIDLALVDDDRATIDLGKKFVMVRTELPASCTEPATDLPPVAVVEGFIDLMDRHYPFFAERNINWEAAKPALLANAAGAANLDEAASIVADFIETMNDGHMSIDAPTTAPPAGTPTEMTFAETVVEGRRLDKYLDATRVELADGAIVYGQLLPTVAFVQINRMAGYGETETADLANYAEFLTRALTDLAGPGSETTKVIIDLRGNGGGSDELAIETISRFVTEPFDLYTKEAHNVASTLQTISVEPSSHASFDGDVVVLISGETASAAEILGAGMYTIGATVIGTPSEGIFSDINPLVLPGGFDFGMSNEIYRDLDGVTYEVRGVPLTIETTGAETFDAALTADELAALPVVEALTETELVEATTGVGGLRTLYGDVCVQLLIDQDADLAEPAGDICTEIFSRALEYNGDEIVDDFVDGTANPEVVLVPIFEEVLMELFS